MRRRAALTLILIVVLADCLWADTDNKGHLYPAIGLATHIFENGHSDALQMTLGLGYELVNPVEIVGRFGYHPLAGSGGLFPSHVYSIYTIGGDIRFCLAFPGYPFGFFAFGGGGRYHPDDFKSPWYGNFGFGLELSVSNSLSLYGEFRRYLIHDGFTCFMFGVKI